MSANTAAESFWEIQELSDHHDCGWFQSGRDEIDQWLVRHALRLHTRGTCRTYVWADQDPFVSGFFSLVPHQVDADQETVRMPGHAGGSIAGYLVAKIGLDHRTVDGYSFVARSDDDSNRRPWRIGNPYLLLIDAVITAQEAARAGGGAYLFIDIENEPDSITKPMLDLGFVPINQSGGTTLHCLSLERNRSSAA